MHKIPSSSTVKLFNKKFKIEKVLTRINPVKKKQLFEAVTPLETLNEIAHLQTKAVGNYRPILPSPVVSEQKIGYQPCDLCCTRDRSHPPKPAGMHSDNYQVVYVGTNDIGDITENGIKTVIATGSNGIVCLESDSSGSSSAKCDDYANINTTVYYPTGMVVDAVGDKLVNYSFPAEEVDPLEQVLVTSEAELVREHSYAQRLETKQVAETVCVMLPDGQVSEKHVIEEPSFVFAAPLRQRCRKKFIDNIRQVAASGSIPGQSSSTQTQQPRHRKSTVTLHSRQLPVVQETIRRRRPTL